MTDSSVAVPAKEYYAKRVRHYLAERGLAEEVLAAVPVNPAGMAMATLTSDIGGVVGGLVGNGSATGMAVGRSIARDVNNHRGRGDVTSSPALVVPKRGIMVLTSGRLLVFSVFGMGFFTGKPKQAAVDVPLGDVVGVTEPALQKGAVQVLRVGVGVRGGRVVWVEFPRVVLTEAAALAAELGRRIGQQG